MYSPRDLDRLLPKLPEPKRSAGRTASAGDADPDNPRLIEWGRLHLGPVFGRLLDGDYSNYRDDEHPSGNPSKAEHGLFCDLLRLTRGDKDRAENLAREYGTYRDKWDEIHFGDGRTYLSGSIDKAVEYLNEDPERWKLPEPTKTVGGDGEQGCRRCCQVEAVLANDGLAPAARIVAIGAILELDRRSGWKRPSKLEQVTETPDGFRIVSRGRLAQRTGMSEAAVGRHLKTIGATGVVVQKVVGLPAGHPDVTTGEIINEPRRYTALKLVGSADEALAGAAMAAPPERPAWGGPGRKQGVCPKHPLAGTVEKARRSLHCEVCNQELGQSAQVVLTDASLPLSSLPRVVIGQEHLVPTGPTTRDERRQRVAMLNAVADGRNAPALREMLERVYARAAPPDDEWRPPDPDDLIWWARENGAGAQGQPNAGARHG